MGKRSQLKMTKLTSDQRIEGAKKRRIEEEKKRREAAEKLLEAMLGPS